MRALCPSSTPRGLFALAAKRRLKLMKTNFSLLEKTTRITPALFGAPPAVLRLRPRAIALTAVILLSLAARSTTFAGSATWDLNPGTSNWNTDSNWTPNTGYPNGSSDVATFDLSNQTSIGVSAFTTVAEIVFNSGASAFTITVGSTDLIISGTGITNNSGTTQNFEISGGNIFDPGGNISFTNSATAGSMTTFHNAGSFGPSPQGSSVYFFDNSSAGSATFTNDNSGTTAGVTGFFNSSTADSSTFINNGGGFSGIDGGATQFYDTSTAGSAKLIANGGVGGGGSIQFFGDSTGGTASVDVRNNGTGTPGNLDISSHNAPGVTIGSLEGSGNVFLGARNLTVGSNNLGKSFSGVIQDGGIVGGTGGSLTKIGTGTLTLSGANTYTGATTVNGGALFVNGSTSSSSAVTVNNSGATLGGNGTIGGTVTVNSGASLAPGPTGNGSTGILNTGSFTLASGSNFSLDLNGDVAGTNYDQVDVTGGVFITGSNLLINTALGLAVGEHLFIVENDGIDAVTGTFAGLPNGATFTQDGVTFQIDYFASGDGGGNDISLTVTAVPEPTTWMGGVLGFVALAYWQRRRFTQLLRRA
jgi:autotransporter-associated beta strand protein